MLYDRNGNKISGKDFIVKPEGFKIPLDASRVHGISTEKANKEGISLQTILQEFQEQISQADYLVAHNISFDEKIAGAEFLRKNMTNSVATKRRNLYNGK